MHNQKQLLFRIMSYLEAFTIGTYAASEFKFNHHIELYRWCISIFFFIFFLNLSKNE